MLLELENYLGRGGGLNMDVQVVLRGKNVVVVVVLFLHELVDVGLAVGELEGRGLHSVADVSLVESITLSLLRAVLLGDV